MSSCPERGWDKLLMFLCATANDCWHLVSEALPAVEERHPQAMAGGFLTAVARPVVVKEDACFDRRCIFFANMFICD